MIRHIKIIFSTGLLLTACAPLQIHYKTGGTVAQMERDLTGCEVSALRSVPADIRSRYIPPVYDHYPICHGHGHCHWHQRLVSPGRFEKYDANLPLRHNVTQQCMADQGYREVKIKRCDAATRRSTPLHATKILPPLTENSCAIRLKSGRWKIVTPGMDF